MKEVIILGGGFAGVSACRALLDKSKENGDINITLIDKNPFHLFTPSLYEVATSEEPMKNIAIPFSEIFPKGVKIVTGNVTQIDIPNKLVRLSDNTSYSFDYLIVALGSEPAYFGIEGLEKYSLPLKTLEDAVLIKQKIKQAYSLKEDKDRHLEIVVGGGGFSGTELTAELITYKNMLIGNHKRSEGKINLSIIQGSKSLLKELDGKVSQVAQKRLTKNNVKLCFGAHIKKVEENFVYTDDGKKYPYDILIWTGGVKASRVLAQSGFKVNGKGQVQVDDKMRVLNLNHGSIYAVGDIAEYGDPATNKQVPGVAEVAEDEGRVAGKNVIEAIQGKGGISYHFMHLGYIVPIKGKFAVADLKRFRLVGFSGWIAQQFTFLYYLFRILPVTKALNKWNKFVEYLIENS